MVSIVDICNQSLQLLRRGLQINSLDDDSEDARNCKNAYFTVRDAELLCEDWYFAQRRVHLQQLADRDEYYQIPPDCLRITRIESDSFFYRLDYIRKSDFLFDYSYQDSGGIRFRVEDDSVYIPNVTNPIAIYTARIENVNFMPADFIDMLVHALALRLSHTYRTENVQNLNFLYNEKLIKMRDNNQRNTYYGYEPSWNEIRRWGSY